MAKTIYWDDNNDEKTDWLNTQNYLCEKEVVIKLVYKFYFCTDKNEHGIYFQCKQYCRAEYKAKMMIQQ